MDHPRPDPLVAKCAPDQRISAHERIPLRATRSALELTKTATQNRNRKEIPITMAALLSSLPSLMICRWNWRPSTPRRLSYGVSTSLDRPLGADGCEQIPFCFRTCSPNHHPCCRTARVTDPSQSIAVTFDRDHPDSAEKGLVLHGAAAQKLQRDLIDRCVTMLTRPK